MHFDEFFLSKPYKDSGKKVQKRYLLWWKIQRKADFWFQRWHEEFGEFSPNPTFENFTSVGSYCRKYLRFELKKYRGVIFHDTKQRWKVWINPELVVSKMAWGIAWNFNRALESLKNCTLMSSFCPKYIIFQLKNFREIMCHDTERWCKI